MMMFGRIEIYFLIFFVVMECFYNLFIRFFYIIVDFFFEVCSYVCLGVLESFKGRRFLCGLCFLVL